MVVEKRFGHLIEKATQMRAGMAQPRQLILDTPREMRVLCQHFQRAL